MHKCPKLEQIEFESKREKLIQCHHLPIELSEGNFDSIETDSERLEAIEVAIDFCHHYLLQKEGFASKKRVKGIYFHGDFGVGKSHLAGCIVNHLAEHHIASIMVHTPSLANEMRDALNESIRGNKQNTTVDNKIELLSSIPILILDDIGMESYTSWIRDNIFGVILQKRANDHLPTIFTSNLDLNGLEEAMSLLKEKGKVYSDRSGARRILERIRPYVVSVAVKGRNRRYD